MILRGLILFSSLIFDGPKIDPLDPIRANFAQTKARIEFEHEVYNTTDSSIAKSLHDYPKGEIPDAQPTVKTRGHWCCDGQSEHSLHPKPFDVAKPGDATNVGPSETLYDGTMLAFHRPGPGSDGNLKVSFLKTPTFRLPGPLSWGLSLPLLDLVRDEVGPIVPTVTTDVHGGHPTTTLTYRKSHENGSTSSYEIALDDAIGGLPRYLNFYSVTTSGTVNVIQAFIVEAKACGSGGFIPTEWYSLRYPLAGLPSDGRPFLPTGRVKMEHFRVTEMVDMSSPAALTDLDGIAGLDADGYKRVSFKRTKPSYSLKDIRSLLKPGNSAPTPRFANIDEEELRRFDGPAPRSYLWQIVISAIALLSVIALAIRRLRAAAILLPFALLASGCSRLAEVAPGSIPLKLEGAITPGLILNDFDTHELPFAFIVTNRGASPIEIRDLDGGCSCRKIDRSTLPTTIEPGGHLTVNLFLEDKKVYDLQKFSIMASTPGGAIPVGCQVRILPRSRVLPDAITLPGLFDQPPQDPDRSDAEAEFELTHRLIGKGPGGMPRTRLDALDPSAFKVEVVEAKQGDVVGAPDYHYRDTTYRVTLIDRTIGDRKSALLIRDESNVVLSEVPVLWKRSPYLSTAPDRVVLGANPIRVFLRCPDEAAEFTRVVSTPPGVKAVVSSVREVEVSATPDAAADLRGEVVVATNTAEGAEVRIPIVRLDLARAGR